RTCTRVTSMLSAGFAGRRCMSAELARQLLHATVRLALGALGAQHLDLRQRQLGGVLDHGQVRPRGRARRRRQAGGEPVEEVHLAAQPGGLAPQRLNAASQVAEALLFFAHSAMIGHGRAAGDPSAGFRDGYGCGCGCGASLRVSCAWPSSYSFLVRKPSPLASMRWNMVFAPASCSSTVRMPSPLVSMTL